MTVTADPPATIPHVPILRRGVPYESLDTVRLVDHRDGAPRLDVSQTNAGIIRRDLRHAREGADALRAFSCAELLDICAEAGRLFMEADLPLTGTGVMQSPQDYVEALSATSGLPHAMCRRNMEKVHTVFVEMPTILRGLTRGLDLVALDRGVAEQDGIPLSYAPTTDALGVVLPSNSPGVNSIWMPALPLKVPVVLKPGREEPWTPLRIMHAYIAAGCPREAFGFYPTDHEGSATIIECCGRSLIFGDAKTTARYRTDPRVQVHGPGWSKVVLADDEQDRWRDHLDVLVRSIVDNGGRSCINASCIVTAGHADAIADALARAVATIEPKPAADPEARLSAHANPRIAAAIDGMIDEALRDGSAEDVTARYRSGPRLVESGGSTYLKPTIIRCPDPDHPLANTEYMFPFASVVELPAAEALDWMGPSLVVTAISKNQALLDAFVRSPRIDRLNLGPVPTTRVDWDQPHEGNLFEFLYMRRAIHRTTSW